MELSRIKISLPHVALRPGSDGCLSHAARANNGAGQNLPALHPRSRTTSTPQLMNLPALIPNPPADKSTGSSRRLERAAFHRIFAHAERLFAAAKADEAEEDLFLYTTVMGDRVQRCGSPSDRRARRAREERTEHRRRRAQISLSESAALQTPTRAYIPSADSPTCQIPTQRPCAHRLPRRPHPRRNRSEKRVEILARADDYAHNRLVCGVHYPSDVEASRKVAYVVFGYMLATPRFQRDLAAARAETRAALGMPTR